MTDPARRDAPARRLRGRRASAAFALLLLLTVPAASRAAPSDQARLDRVRGQIEDLKKEIEQTGAERDRTRTELREAEQAAAKATAALHKTESALAAGDARLKELGKEQADLQRRLDRSRTGLARQVRAAYTTGRQEYLKLLLNQEDPSTISRVLTYYRYMARARAEEIGAIDTALERLDTVTRDIDAEHAELERLRQGQLAYQQELADTHKKRAEILARLDRELADKTSQIGPLRAEAARLKGLLAKLSTVMEDAPRAPGGEEKFADARGHMRLPAAGRIAARYGALKDGGPLSWQGLLIDGREGETVNAVFSGRVAYAGWFGSLGLLLILDHGDGYMSLYGHNEVLYTEVGDWVETGQKVASLGTSGGLRSAGLYFEIRHNGEPRDPLQWCPERFAARP